MLPFEEEIGAALKEALKAKDQVKLDVLRDMKSSLQYKFIEKKQQTLSLEEAFFVFQSLIKQREESCQQYEKFNRPDRAAKERREVEIISLFLPKPLSEEALHTIIQETIEELKAQSSQDMGRVMKALKFKIVGRADGKKVATLVQGALAKLQG